MQLSGKAPIHGLNDALRTRHQQVQQGDRVNEALAGDPAFQVRTIDGRNWICPYTHTLIPLTDGTLAPARVFLWARHPWTSGRGKPRPLVQVLEQKWMLHLSSPAVDPLVHLRFASDGRWQNPYTGAWVGPLRRPDAPPARYLPRVALALATSPEAQSGEPLPTARLDALKPDVLKA